MILLLLQPHLSMDKIMPQEIAQVHSCVNQPGKEMFEQKRECDILRQTKSILQRQVEGAAEMKHPDLN